jgi:hypothetical protein
MGAPLAQYVSPSEPLLRELKHKHTNCLPSVPTQMMVIFKPEWTPTLSSPLLLAGLLRLPEDLWRLSEPCRGLLPPWDWSHDAPDPVMSVWPLQDWSPDLAGPLLSLTPSSPCQCGLSFFRDLGSLCQHLKVPSTFATWEQALLPLVPGTPGFCLVAPCGTSKHRRSLLLEPFLES